jgi:dihydrofolate reductase
MRVSLIAAVASNGVIGRDGGLPWHLPADLARFKALTMGHHLVVGRRTWESIGRPLPGRRMVVVSGGAPELPPGVQRAGSLAGALALAARAGEEEVFVGGGAALFAEALPLADRLYLTRVLAEVPGDVHLPPIDEARWRETSREHHPADERHAYPFVFVTLERG